MVDWLAGKRVRGTSSERTPLGTALGGTGVGGWVELGRTTLGSAGDTIDVSSVPDKRYYMILGHNITDGAGKIQSGMRFGNGSVDSGTNYSNRYSQDGGSDVIGTSQNSAYSITAGIEQDADMFRVNYMANLSGNEKLHLGHIVSQSSAGAATVPIRGEAVGKWTNTSNPVDYFRSLNAEVGSYATGSELVILGWDPDDTHTNNFWEELASVDLSGGASDTISSGTFTAKKYLWIQCFTGNTGGATRASLRVGNTTIDTGNNYAYRRSTNGAGDALFTSTNRIHASSGAVADTEFTNVFIINNASNEKLAITHDVRRSTAGAGNAPTRDETVGKWTNTSNQINIVEFFNDQAGDFGTNTILKVWGAD